MRGSIFEVVGLYPKGVRVFTYAGKTQQFAPKYGSWKIDRDRGVYWSAIDLGLKHIGQTIIVPSEFT